MTLIFKKYTIILLHVHANDICFARIKYKAILSHVIQIRALRLHSIDTFKLSFVFILKINCKIII